MKTYIITNHKFYIYTIVFILLSVILYSCEKPFETDVRNQESTDRTVLVYMVADNNLNRFAIKDLEEMEKGWNSDIKGKLLVLYNKSGGNNTLYEITNEGKKVIRNYGNNDDPNDMEFFKSIIDFTFDKYPASSKGLFLWSHGSGWLPRNGYNGSIWSINNNTTHTTPQNYISKLDGLHNSNNVAEYTIGASGSKGSEMEIYDIATTLKGYSFDYIYFDACYMASVELAYQLKDITKYVVASAAETLADGAPYQTITPYMFGINVEQTAINLAKGCFEYYNEMKTPVLRSSTNSVIKTSELTNLAQVVKNIVSQEVVSTQIDNVQHYGRYDYKTAIFDLQDFLINNWTDINTTQKTNLQNALRSSVVYKNSTKYMFQGDNDGKGTLYIKTHSGLSTFHTPYPNSSKSLPTYLEKYSWSEDSGLGEVFINQ